MPKFEVKDISGKSVGSVDASDAVFAEEVNEHLLWEVVKWQRAGWRQGTHSTKHRGEVAGSKKKPYKQKGTGNARAGHKRSPVWVGGASVWGPKPRDYSYTMPKKAKKKALRGALSLRAGEKKLIVVDKFTLENGKTKEVVKALSNLGADLGDHKVLIVDSKENQGLVRGAGNLQRSKWIAPEGLNVYDVLNHDTLVIAQDVLPAIEKRLEA